MKHPYIGNTPRCKSCLHYRDDYSVKHQYGTCMIGIKVNGRLVVDKPVACDENQSCCHDWIDFESGHTYFEVMTSVKEPVGEERQTIDWDSEHEAWHRRDKKIRRIKQGLHDGEQVELGA